MINQEQIKKIKQASVMKLMHQHAWVQRGKLGGQNKQVIELPRTNQEQIQQASTSGFSKHSKSRNKLKW